MSKQKNPKQLSFTKTKTYFQFNHGGALRNLRAGRGVRPLSVKEPLHLVFKINKNVLKTKSLRTPFVFKLCSLVIEKYAKHFFIKIEQVSINNDHIHLLIRTHRRSSFLNFFRVVPGQIAQKLEKEGLLRRVTDTPVDHAVYAPATKKSGSVTDTPTNTPANTPAGVPTATREKSLKLWKYRPFTRVIRGYKAYKTVVAYIKLNIKEALGEIRYQSKRLKGLSTAEWEILMS